MHSNEFDTWLTGEHLQIHITVIIARTRYKDKCYIDLP